MTQLCDAALHLCRIRVTRLDALGNPVAGPNNVYVSDKPIMVSVKPEVEAGVTKTLVGGCDCIIADYRGFDKLKRFNFQFDMGVIEPGLLEMLLGTTSVLDNQGDIIGNWWPSQLTCSQPAQPNVAFEAWQDLWSGDHQESTYPYLHWIWPSTHWQISDATLQNDFNQPSVTGFSRGNDNWGLGIFGDLPEAAEPLGGYVFSHTIPDAGCHYQSWAIT